MKTSMRTGSRILFCKKLAVLMITLFVFNTTSANPTGGQVTAGDATINHSGNNTEIKQTSDQAIINWQSFNINSNETTHFQQPSANSITLNRINPGQGASQIFGRLTATGRIILVNQAGLYFGPSAFVDVGSLIVSTANISDQNFLAGKYSFDQPSTMHGVIVNAGIIHAADHGLIALIGSNVSNEGNIQVSLGNVILASGDKFTVDLTGDGLINFSIDADSTGSGRDINGRIMADGVSNSGTVSANGGKIIMSARAAEGVVNHTVNMSGIAEAHSVAQSNGEIILSANSNIKISGRIDVSGKGNNANGGKIKIVANKINITKKAILDASGDLNGGTILIKTPESNNSSITLAGNITANGYTGGSVKLLSDAIHLQSNAVIDVSGYTQGGEALIGGNMQGKGTEQHAKTVTLDAGAKILANAITMGNGGKVIVWSDGTTNFHGNISAHGGAQGGNGGFVETSGKHLDVADSGINLTAANGQMGTWLLDPENIIIQNNNGSNSNGSYNGNVYTPTGDNSIVDSNLLQTALASANVVITTGSSGSQQGNITVAAPITWNSNTTLTLNAANMIEILSNGNAPMISAPRGNLELNAPNLVRLNGSLGIGGYVAVNSSHIESFQKPLIADVGMQASSAFIPNYPSQVASPIVNTASARVTLPYSASKTLARAKKQIDDMIQQQREMDTVQIGQAKIACNRGVSNTKVCDSLDITMAMNNM